ncbi:MAG: xanthine dehydrogenase family protein subunit M [Alphaproteobacteria bacterium]
MMGDYRRPHALSEALATLGEGRWLVLAGGTDIYPARVCRPLDEPVLDIGAIEGLRGIEAHADHWRINALTTWSELLAAPLPLLFDGLKLAAREVGGRQIQNAGTVAGNVCNAAPAADGMPCLLALDAMVELSSQGGARRLRLEDFVTGPRETARRPDELVTALIVPKPAQPAGASHFLKLGARRYLVISIVMVALVLVLDEAGRIAEARIAVGACSPVAKRLPALEAALEGRILLSALADIVRDEHVAPLAPIDDIRASAAYRLEAAASLLRRGLAELGGRA